MFLTGLRAPLSDGSPVCSVWREQRGAATPTQPRLSARGSAKVFPESLLENFIAFLTNLGGGQLEVNLLLPGAAGSYISLLALILCAPCEMASVKVLLLQTKPWRC